MVEGHTTPTEEEEEDARPIQLMPDELACPISMQLMTDAVMADDGHTYQLHAIKKWIDKCTAGNGAWTSMKYI